MPASGKREQQVQAVVLMAQRRFAELGVRTTVRLGAAGSDPSLVAADRRTYPLDDLLAAALPIRGRERARLIDEHVGRMVREGPGLDRLDPDDLRARVRTWLLPAEEAHGVVARPFSEGLVEGLCLRLPEAVVPISDDLVTRLALPAAELWVFGRQNTAAEPVEERTEVAPGVLRFDAESPCLAAKAADLAPLVGSPRFGTVFTVPRRRTLLAVPIDGEAALNAVDTLARTLAAVLAGEQGSRDRVLSDALHFSRGGAVHRISDRDPGTKSMRILAAGPFGEALDELESHLAARSLPSGPSSTDLAARSVLTSPGTTGV